MKEEVVDGLLALLIIKDDVFEEDFGKEEYGFILDCLIQLFVVVVVGVI